MSGLFSGVALLLAERATGIQLRNTRESTLCESGVPAGVLEEMESAISSNAVLLFGLEGYRCTTAGEQALSSRHVCYEKQMFTGGEDPRLGYLRCKYASMIGEIGSGSDNMWHSYLFISGEYIGDGFKADSAPNFGKAALTCGKNCDSLLPSKERAELQAVITSAPVTLWGWGGCPCTSIAVDRFRELGVCFVENVWADRHDSKLTYLQCVYGEEHHSFVFFRVLQGRIRGQRLPIRPDSDGRREAPGPTQRGRRAHLVHQGRGHKPHGRADSQLHPGRRRHHNRVDTHWFLQLGCWR